MYQLGDSLYTFAACIIIVASIPGDTHTAWKLEKKAYSLHTSTVFPPLFLVFCSAAPEKKRREKKNPKGPMIVRTTRDAIRNWGEIMRKISMFTYS